MFVCARTRMRVRVCLRLNVSADVSADALTRAHLRVCVVLCCVVLCCIALCGSCLDVSAVGSGKDGVRRPKSVIFVEILALRAELVY